MNLLTLLLTLILISSCNTQSAPKLKIGECLMSPDGFFYKIDSINSKNSNYQATHWNSVSKKWDNIKDYNFTTLESSPNFVPTDCPK